MAAGFRGLWEAVFGWLAKPPTAPSLHEIIDFDLEIATAKDFIVEIETVADFSLELF